MFHSGTTDNFGFLVLRMLPLDHVLTVGNRAELKGQMSSHHNPLGHKELGHSKDSGVQYCLGMRLALVYLTSGTACGAWEGSALSKLGSVNPIFILPCAINTKGEYNGQSQ